MDFGLLMHGGNMATKSKEAQCVEKFQLDALAIFHERLVNIHDKRRKQGLRYPLVTVLMTMLLACIAGADSASGFELWAKTHEEELSLYLDMPHGPPTQDVFLNILATLDVEEFESLYQAWVPVCTALQGKEINTNHLAIDGKTSRRSYDLAKSKLSAHTLGVMAVENGILISEKDCSRKTNEISVIPMLLNELNLKSATVTIDAIAAQTKIVDTIIEKDGDYIIGVKGNQPNLYTDIEQLTQKRKPAIDAAKKKNEYEYSCEFDKGHGRLEQRETYVFSDIYNDIRDCAKWRGLLAVVLVVRTITKLNPKENQTVTTTETQYYITSKSSSKAAEIGNLIRNHWNIENGCHWILDVVFREDDARNRAGNSAKNFATLRRMALAIIKSEQSKTSIHLRRMRAAWDFKYLVSLTGIKEK
jgi:predicted transposase YbfD/YdcC